MKFVKIIIGLNETELNKKFDTASPTYQNEIDNLFNNFEYVKLKGNNVIIYAVLNNSQIEKLGIIFKNLVVGYYIMDISSKILFGEIEFYKEVEDYLLKGTLKLLIDEYQENNLSIDFILDKINKNGINSLTELDKKFFLRFNIFINKNDI